MRVKVCGITGLDDAAAVVKAGADAIGLVFYGPSPRNLSDLALAREIALSVGPFVTVVGLFVDPEMSDVNRVISAVPLHVLQFHGNESEAFCRQFNRPYLKVIRMRDDIDLDGEIRKYPSASGILLDTYRKGVPGGTGESFNWDRVPSKAAKPIVLAGGLSPENVGQAVKIAKPYGVDVSGGVEAAPGIKDKIKVQAFVANARAERLSE